MNWLDEVRWNADGLVPAVAQETTIEFAAWRPNSHISAPSTFFVAPTTAERCSSVGASGIGITRGEGVCVPEYPSAITQSTGYSANATASTSAT